MSNSYSSYRKMDPHQIEAQAYIRSKNGQAGLFMAPGTGKTIVAIRAARTPSLVICRRDDLLTWKLELAMESYEPHEILEINYGTYKGESFPLPQMSLRCEDNAIQWVLVTYDLLKQAHILAWVMKQPFGSVYADESHMIKSARSGRTKIAIKATRHIIRRVAMTGSAIGNEPLDIFSQCLFIDNGKTFGDNEWKFRSKYYIKSGPGWYAKREANELIGRKLSTMSYYVHEDDVLKLPPVRHITKSVPMNDAQISMYEKVLIDWEIEIAANPEIIEINHVIVQLAKLRQVASGFIYYYPNNDPNNPRVTQWLSDNKIDLMLGLMKDNAYLGRVNKIVIASAHVAEIKRIIQRLDSQDVSYVVLYGEISQNHREHARKTFYHDPSIRCFVAQADMLTGMNELIVAANMIYISNSLKAISRQQSQRRIRRKGSEHHKLITYWDIVSEGTVDVPLVNNIQGMMMLAHYILSGLKAGRPIKQILTNLNKPKALP